MPQLGNSRRHHPHQVFVAGLCVLTGLPVVLGGPKPGSLAAAMPGELVLVVAACLSVGGGIVLAAAAVRNLLTALYLELVADLPLALCLASYTAALVAVPGHHKIGAIITFGGAGIAFAVRFIQVMKAFRRLHRELVRRTARA